jgi:bifunctional non-homologous end joining protein LigD
LRVRSRRGWNMTEHVDFLEQLPVRAVLDGELVAFDAEGKPDFERVCERILFRHAEVPVIFLAFHLLSLDGRDLRPKPYRERRQVLAELELEGPHWRVPEAFDDSPALWEAICEHELEGVVAKRLHEPYLCGERAWVKVKNRAYWRYELEREEAMRSRQSKSGTAV